LYFSYYIIKFFLPNSFWHVLPNFLLLCVSLFFASLKLLNQKFLQNKTFTIDIMALVNRYGLCVLDMPTDMFRLLWWRIKRIHSTLFHKKNGQRRYKYPGKDQILFCNKNTLILTKSVFVYNNYHFSSLKLKPNTNNIIEIFCICCISTKDEELDLSSLYWIYASDNTYSTHEVKQFNIQP
jgi:hypothetical protein